MTELVRRLLDLLYPPKCMLCRRILPDSRTSVCPACMDRLPEHDGANPHVQYAERCIATFFYEDTLREAFHRFKFGGCTFYAEQFGDWMSVTIGDKLAGKFDCVSWVPVSKKRRRERGYDQTELLCRRICENLGVRPVPLLRKTRHTPMQSGLHDAAARAANVRGAYEENPDADPAGKHILLIDDIVTTGATLSECCRVLLTAGAESVVCAALATPRSESKRTGELL